MVLDQLDNYIGGKKIILTFTTYYIKTQLQMDYKSKYEL